MSRAKLYWVAYFCIPLIYFMSLPVHMGDLGVWIRLGLENWSHGSVIRTDSFSVLPTSPMVYPYGTTMLYAGLEKLGGLSALLCFHRLWILLYLFIVAALSFPRVWRSNPWTPQCLLWVAFSWFGLSAVAIDRPALLAIVPFALAFSLLDREEAWTTTQAWWFLGVELLWVQLHGSWVLAPALLSWRTLGRLTRKHGFDKNESLALAASFLIPALNPFGFSVWKYVLLTDEVSRARGLAEWAPTILATGFESQAMAYVALCLALMIWESRRLRVIDWSSPLFPLLISGWMAIRHTQWPFLAMLIYLGRRNSFSAPEEGPGISRYFNPVAAAGLVGIFVALLPPIKPTVLSSLPAGKDRLYGPTAPTALAALVRGSGDAKPIFNQFELGSYLIYALPNKIYADTRNIIYAQADIDRYSAAIQGKEGWKALLDEHHFGWVMIDALRSEGLRSKLVNDPEWTFAGSEGATELYRRAGAAGPASNE